MIGHGYTRSSYDSCVYYRQLANGSFVYLLLYVDDMLIATKSMLEIKRLKSLLGYEFEMKDLGAMKKILGMEIHRDRKAGKLYLSQKKYFEKVLERFAPKSNVIGYVDSDYVGDLDKRRFLTGFVFTFSGCATSWKATL
jgi:hypothetical protein